MTNKYVEKLYNTWAENYEIIIAVDFNTLNPLDPDQNSQEILKLLNSCSINGAKIIVLTFGGLDAYSTVVAYLAKHNIRVDAINENVKKLPYGAAIYADAYLSENAGLLDEIEILEEALIMYKQYQSLIYQKTD